MDFLSLEDGTERLPRKFGTELPFYAHKKHTMLCKIPYTIYSGMFRFLKNHHQGIYKIMDSEVCRIYEYISECTDIEIVHFAWNIECSMSPHPVHMLCNLHHIGVTARK
jgi:hypothetical protein